MSKDRAFPAFYWNPKTKEKGLFNSAAEVPEGYLDHHPDAKDAIPEKAAKPLPPAIPMTKEEILTALTAGGITAKASASTKSLYDLLLTNLRDHLTEAKVSFPETATAPELLALVPKTE